MGQKRDNPPREAFRKENLTNNANTAEAAKSFDAPQTKNGERRAAPPPFKEPINLEKTECNDEKPRFCQEKKEDKENLKIRNPRGIMGFFEKFLPPGIYNPKTKKFFGLLSGEDVLILALILFFTESEDEESGIIILALLYLLISERLDLSDLF